MIEKIDGDKPWLITIDNIFLDVAKELTSDQWLIDRNVTPGSQNTAYTPEMKRVA